MAEKSICVVVIATNNYANYAANLIESLLQTQNKHLTIHLFTDQLLLHRRSIYDTVITHTVFHEPWPMITLRKFEFLSSISDEITVEEYDHLQMLKPIIQMLPKPLEWERN